MTDLLLRAHFEASAYGISRAPSVDPEDIVRTVDDFRTEYPLTFWERLYLRFLSDSFTGARARLDTRAARPGLLLGGVDAY